MVIPPVKDLLVPYDRPPRRDLREWAGELTAGLLAQSDPVATAELLNNAALVFSYAGDRETARWACASQLRRLARLARHDELMLSLALQPYVNLGRLEALDGRHGTARSHFALIKAALRHRPVSLGPCELGKESWPVVLDGGRDLGTVLTNVYVIDTVKSWFAEGDYRAALDFVVHLDGEGVVAPAATVLEAKVACLVELGQHVAAVEVAAGAADPYTTAVAGLHIVRSIVALGASDDALACALQLMRVAAWAEGADIPANRLTALLRFFERHAIILRSLHRPDEAAVQAEVCFAHAMSIGDQVSAHRAAQFLVALLPPGAARQRWCDEMAAVGSACDYAVVRAVTAAAAPPAPYVRLAAAVGDSVGERPPVTRIP